MYVIDDDMELIFTWHVLIMFVIMYVIMYVIDMGFIFT